VISGQQIKTVEELSAPAAIEIDCRAMFTF
jgi:hypothetical protein